MFHNHTIHCDQCASVVINGTPYHETGCPDEYIDLHTGEPKQAPCWHCGCDYQVETPAEYRNRWRACPDCQHPEYNAESEEPTT